MAKDYPNQVISDWLAGTPLLDFDEFTGFAYAAKIFKIKVYAFLLQMTCFICEITAKHKVITRFQRNYSA